ncbi:hypothetical protein [Streptomyces sp. AP-93]|uniref:hypothetical protein n=1 Tax=Streptomyces sp. AP-93 TaxID=2929048 RepID=UPI001FAF8079|nr:hypothetical protein [Streptomyces sp. AP-93]MCJ0869541.1 hypothetical protein [Streptomyces sp. AP-93]
MQPIRALRRASAVAAGVVAVLLLVCGGLFTHPASAGHAAGMRMSGPQLNGSPAPAGMAAGMPGTAEAPAIAGTPTMDMDMDMGPGSGAGAGTDGGCSASGQDCPLASAYAPTVQAGPAGDLAGSALGAMRSVDDGHPRPVPPSERSRPRAPDLDSLCVSRT